MYHLKEFKLDFFALLLLVIAISCKKNDTAPTAPTPLVQELAIHFSTETIPLQNVDSAIVTVRDANQSIKKMIRLQNRTAYLYTSLTDLAEGVYTAEIRIHTKKEQDNTARQFALKKTFTLPLHANLQLKAPTGNFTTDTWFKRAVLFAPREEVIATVAMDPRDAFYEIQFNEAQWNYSRLQRSVLYNQALIALEEHTRNLPGIIGFTDYTAFDSYTQTAGGKLWTKAYISLYIKHQSGRGITLDYEYSR